MPNGLPRLKTIRLREVTDSDTDNYAFGPGTIQPVFRVGAPFLRSWHSLYLQPFTRTRAEGAGDLARGEIAPSTLALDWKGFVQALASSSGSVPDAEFPFDKPECGFPGDIHGMTDVSQVDLEAASTKLRSLRMRLQYFREPRMYILQGMHAILPAASKLQRLKLQYDGPLDYEMLSYPMVFPNSFVLPKLRALKLDSFSMQCKEMCQFVSRQRDLKH